MSEKHYAHYLTTVDYFKLDTACMPFWAAFPNGGIYLVGSALRKRDWRDVDVRAILEDEDFARLFPGTDERGESAHWKLICISISAYLTQMTGLPVDFQIQSMTLANKLYPKDEEHGRSAIGLSVQVRFSR